ncbi:hypothetical protein YC2023_098326 [Brassica napus]
MSNISVKFVDGVLNWQVSENIESVSSLVIRLTLETLTFHKLFSRKKISSVHLSGHTKSGDVTKTKSCRIEASGTVTSSTQPKTSSVDHGGIASNFSRSPLFNSQPPAASCRHGCKHPRLQFERDRSGTTAKDTSWWCSTT